MLYTRTGLTEGTLVYNQFLKTKDCYSKKTEHNFIDWLYKTSGFYDSAVDPQDYEQVKASPTYQTFLGLYKDSLFNAHTLDLMVHDGYWVNESFKSEFSSQFSPKHKRPFYWQDRSVILPLIKNKQVVVINDVAPLYKQYGFHYLSTPTTFFNTGPNANYLETLAQLVKKATSLTWAEVFLISAGAYAAPLAQQIHLSGKTALVLGSGLQSLFPVVVPEKLKPPRHEEIEDSKYW